jgi:hypothetical protein
VTIGADNKTIRKIIVPTISTLSATKIIIIGALANNNDSIAIEIGQIIPPQ